MPASPNLEISVVDVTPFVGLLVKRQAAGEGQRQYLVKYNRAQSSVSFQKTTRNTFSGQLPCFASCGLSGISDD